MTKYAEYALWVPPVSQDVRWGQERPTSISLQQYPVILLPLRPASLAQKIPKDAK